MGVALLMAIWGPTGGAIYQHLLPAWYQQCVSCPLILGTRACVVVCLSKVSGGVPDFAIKEHRLYLSRWYFHAQVKLTLFYVSALWSILQILRIGSNLGNGIICRSFSSLVSYYTSSSACALN
jgi:hypothetical protein